MDQDKEKRFLQTITKTLHAYEELIEDPEKNIHKWKDFGHHGSCRICKIFRTDTFYDCFNCPLGESIYEEIHNSISIYGCLDAGLGYLYNALQVKDYINVKKYAKIRYKAIIKKIKQHGYEYK